MSLIKLITVLFAWYLCVTGIICFSEVIETTTADIALITTTIISPENVCKYLKVLPPRRSSQTYSLESSSMEVPFNQSDDLSATEWCCGLCNTYESNLCENFQLKSKIIDNNKIYSCLLGSASDASVYKNVARNLFVLQPNVVNAPFIQVGFSENFNN